MLHLVWAICGKVQHAASASVACQKKRRARDRGPSRIRTTSEDHMHKLSRLAATAAVIALVSWPASAVLAQTTPDAAAGTAAAPAAAPATPPAAASSDASSTDKDAPKKKKKTARKMTRQQEVDRSIDRGTVPARYRNRVPKEYQQYVPFEKQ